MSMRYAKNKTAVRKLIDKNVYQPRRESFMQSIERSLKVLPRLFKESKK